MRIAKNTYEAFSKGRKSRGRPNSNNSGMVGYSRFSIISGACIQSTVGCDTRITERILRQSAKLIFTDGTPPFLRNFALIANFIYGESKED